MTASNGSKGDFKINGKVYDSNDLSFREQREVRRIIREELVGDPEVDINNLDLPDVLPALCVVLVKRDNPEYTLEEALDLKAKDVLVDDADPTPPSSRKRK